MKRTRKGPSREIGKISVGKGPTERSQRESAPQLSRRVSILPRRRASIVRLVGARTFSLRNSSRWLTSTVPPAGVI